MGKYMFNGTFLPEWDETAQPYGTITLSTSTGTEQYFLRLSTSPKTVLGTGSTVLISCDYILQDGVWVEGSANASGKVVWANYDVYYADDVEEVGGTLYLAASDPIPVNPAPTLDPTALLMGWQVGNRIRGGA